MIQYRIVFMVTSYIASGLCNHTIGWDGGYVSDDFPGQVVEYVYFTEKVTWNEARSVCQEIGGDLAKVDSKHVKDLLVHVANTAYPPEFFGSDRYWVGLFETTAGDHTWALDCSALSYQSNFAVPWDSYKQCFRLKPSSGHIGEREECDETEQFLCETHSANECRVKDYTSFTTSERHEGNYTHTTCKLLCEQESYCLGMIYVPPDLCVAFYGNGSVTSNTAMKVPGEIRIGTRFCMKFRWNSTQVNPVENDDEEPNTACGITNGLPLSSSIYPTLSSTLSPATSSSLFSLSPSESMCSCSMMSTEVTSYTCSPPSTITQTISHTIIHSNITLVEAEKLAEELSKNLTVDTKQTSAHHRKLTSANDRRRTSVVMGTVGVVSLALPFGLIILGDIKRILDDLGLLGCCKAD